MFKSTRHRPKYDQICELEIETACNFRGTIGSTTLVHVILSNDPDPSAELVDVINLPLSHSVLEFQLLCCCKWLQLLSLQAEPEVLLHCCLVKG